MTIKAKKDIAYDYENYGIDFYKDKIYQIFAHNLSEPGRYPESLDNYEINEHFAMLDARKSFILEPDGKIKEARKVER